MFYISPKLTLLMLAVVPPVSLGAVSYTKMQDLACILNRFVIIGILWPISEKAIKQDPGSSR